MRVHCEAIVALQDAGAVAVDYGNNLRGYAEDAGFENAFAYPGFVPAYIRDLFCEGKGPFRWVALSGDPDDIYRTDELVLEMFPEDEHLCRWIKMARERVTFQGLPARICWLGQGAHHGGGVGMGLSVHAGQVICADGTSEMEERLKAVLTNDPGIGVARHVDAGYELARGIAQREGIRIPMDER